MNLDDVLGYDQNPEGEGILSHFENEASPEVLVEIPVPLGEDTTWMGFDIDTNFPFMLEYAVNPENPEFLPITPSDSEVCATNKLTFSDDTICFLWYDIWN